MKHIRSLRFFPLKQCALLKRRFKSAEEDHCVKIARTRSYSGPHFPVFELNTEKYGLSLHIQSKLRENTDQKYGHFLTQSIESIL